MNAARAFAPATVANVVVGFDALGHAVDGPGDLVTLEDGETQIVEIPMAVRPIPVGGVTVEAEAGEPEVPGLAGTGFYDRWSRGEGQFLLPGEVARHPAAFGDDLLVYLNQLVTIFNAHVHPGELAIGVLPVTPAPPVAPMPPAQPSLISTKVFVE